LIGVAPARGSVRRAAFAPAAADAFDAAAPMVRESTTEELAWDGEVYEESTSINKVLFPRIEALGAPTPAPSRSETVC
jgi:hypothetical protein